MDVRFQDICGQSIMLKLPKNATVSDACESLSKRIDASNNIIFLVSQEANRRHRFYQNGDLIDDILKHNKECIIFMKLPKFHKKKLKPKKYASKNFFTDFRHLNKIRHQYRSNLPIYRQYNQILKCIPPDFDEKVNQIAQLGYQVDDIKEALRSSFYDVQGAINELVHMNSNFQRNDDDYDYFDEYEMEDYEYADLRRHFLNRLYDFGLYNDLRNERQQQQRNERQQQRNEIQQKRNEIQQQRNERQQKRIDDQRNERQQKNDDQRNERQKQRNEKQQRADHIHERFYFMKRYEKEFSESVSSDDFDDDEPENLIHNWKPIERTKMPSFDLRRRFQPPPPKPQKLPPQEHSNPNPFPTREQQQSKPFPTREQQQKRPNPFPTREQQQSKPFPTREQQQKRPNPFTTREQQQSKPLPPPQNSTETKQNKSARIDSKVKIELPSKPNKLLFTFDKPKNTPPPPKPQPEQEEEEDHEIQNQKEQQKSSRNHKKRSFKPKITHID